MWVIVLSKDRTDGTPEEVELAEFGKGVVFSHFTKKKVFAALQLDDAGLTVEGLQELIANPSLVVGGGQLKWFQPGLEADIRRMLDANEAKNEKAREESRGGDRVAAFVESLFGDALKGGRLKKGIPPELAEQLREHHKECKNPFCLVPRPPEEKPSEGEAEIKVGDLVRWVDSSSFKRAGRAIKPFPKKTPFSELPESALKLTDDLFIGINRLAEFSHHDRYLVEMVEGGEIVYAAPRVDMLTVVDPRTVTEPSGHPAAAPEGSGSLLRVGDIVRVREWSGQVNDITWLNKMADSLSEDFPIAKIENGVGKVNNWWIPLSQLDLVRRAEDAAPASSPE